MSIARQFTKVNVQAAFYKLRVAKGDEPKTTFCTCFSLYKQLVYPFSLTSAPATFQRYINIVLSKTLSLYAIAYLNNVLVYIRESQKDYIEKVRSVLYKLQDSSLNLNLSKLVFAVKEIAYLRYIIKAGRAICSNLDKLATIRN